MDYLQEGIGLRAVGQRDPLVEYQREGYDLFVAMMDGIKEESVGFLFNVQVQVEDAAPTTSIAVAGGVDVLDAPPPSGPPVEAATPLADEAAAATPDRDSYALESPAGVTEAAVEGAPAPSVVADPEPQTPSRSRRRRPLRRPPRPRLILPKNIGAPQRPANLTYSAPSIDGGATPSPGAGAAAPGSSVPAGPTSRINAGEGGSTGQITGSSPPRNRPCPCGSGKKYKLCHGRPGMS